MKTRLVNGNVYLNGKFVKTDLTFDKNIISVGCDNSNADKIIDCTDKFITPGFIDIHIHGREGFDVTENCKAVAELLPRYGVTSFLPTTLTKSYSDTLKDLSVLSDYINNQKSGAEALGIYSEGIFFSKEKCGAQNPENIKVEIDFDFVNKMLAASGGKLKVMAFAPENKGSAELTVLLKQKGVRSSMAHTNALESDVEPCLKNGLDGVTHIYNGMRWMNHLELGASGVGVFNGNLYAELITDGFHVNKEFIKILFAVKPIDKILFISDNVPLSGLPEGKSDMFGVPVKILSDRLEVDNNNGVYSLAGSCLRLCDSIKNVHAFTGIPYEKLIKCVTENPAEYIGVNDRKGSIEVGFDSDINIFDKDFNLIKTFVKGELV
ncbi:MAG: N-acetylglucosamine-6-phosphate deacetylase [Clostridia bacterium]|nr:N-acetylglucosamine-6-phosphate deacetylase [Clostridia bacterium]